MKTRSLSIVSANGTRLLAGIQTFLAASLTLIAGASQPTTSDYAHQVSQAHLFMEPLVWVGTQPPPDAESQALLKDISVFKSKGPQAGFAALEHFLTEHPHSPWAPALEANMAVYYRHTGSYITALSHWQAAWNATKNSKDAAGQKIAVQAFAGWTRLLASLGHTKRLTVLFDELDSLQLPLGPYASEIQNTRDAMEIMKARPGFSYRCGSYALGHLGMALHLKQQVIRKLFETDSPNGGFKMSELLALAKTNGLAVEAVQRPPGAKLVVPCVVHWKLNHYAAIVQQKGGHYLVEDPTFNGNVWMTAATIEAESSGDFILPRDRVPPSWKRLGELACAKIYGKGYPNWINDNNDGPPPNPCPDNSGCNPPASNDGAGGGGGVPPPPPCGGCSNPSGSKGMPQWYVSQPYITLWLTDSPLLYHQSSGQWMRLELYYKSRAPAQDTGLGGFGDNWACNWLSMLQKPAGSSGAILTVMPIGVVKRPVHTNGLPTYKGGFSFKTVTWPPRQEYGSSDPQALISPTGGENVYGYTNNDMSGDINYLIIGRADRYSRILKQFNYVATNNVAQLTTVLDMDGRTNTLTYSDPNHPWLVTAVTDPYGRTAHFYYDFSQDVNGLLTNIVDAQGMSTYFQYDSSNEITTMITPYGTNSFQYFDGTDTNGGAARSLLISEPNGYHQLYAYRDDAPISEPVYDSFPSYRLSFHWNPEQYDQISAQGKTNALDMTTADYQLASYKHWLHEPPGGSTLSVSDSMDSQGGPYDPVLQYNPNVIGYTWQGEDSPYISSSTSTDAMKRVTGIYLEDSTVLIARNNLGRPTTYTYEDNNGSQATYSNFFDTTGTILQYETGPNNELVRGYGYDPALANLLTSVTNAVGDVLRYTHDTNTLKVTSITFPGGMVRTNIYYASGPAKGFLEMQADEGVRTNWFVWQDGNLIAETNELGLVTTHTYDNLNRLTSTTYPDGTTTSNIYDKLDLAATKDRLNHWTYYNYNSIRQLTAATNADEQVTTYGYCSCGSPDEIIHWDGSTPFITQLNYDIIGRLTNTIYPDGYQLNYTYDDEDRPATVIDGDGHELQLSWYQRGFQKQLQSAALGTTNANSYFMTLLSRGFDEYGRVISSTNRDSVTVTNGYDFLNRLVARQSFGNSDAPFGFETFAYNALGLTNYTDALGHLTTFVRDVAGRVIAETNADNQPLQFTYNPANELLSLTDGKGQITHWNYDQYGRVTNKVDASNQIDFVYQYDAGNRLTNRWSAAKGATVYRYDALGNLTNVDYSDGTVYTPSIYFAYDGLNRLTNMLDGIGDTTFTWTPGNQLAGENGPWDDDAVSYTYDPGSRQRIAMSIAMPNASPWIQDYNYEQSTRFQFMRLSSVVSPAGEFDYDWEASYYDLLQQMYLPNNVSGTRITYSFDGLARPIDRQLLTPLGQLQMTLEYKYAYDAGSEVTQEVYSAGATSTGTYSGPNFHTLDYQYDGIGQLVGAQGYDGNPNSPPNPPRLQEQFGYAYDKAWNLSVRTNNDLVQSFGVNDLNELTSANHSGTLTVAGSAGEPELSYYFYPTAGVTNVTVNGQTAALYLDGTFAATNFTPTNGLNTYTAIAQDNEGRWSTNSVMVDLPASPSYTYDLNGNLVSDGTRNFAYDDENELVSVWVTNQWREDFAYDGLMRRRITRQYSWNGGAWQETNETHYIYDGYLVVQERDANNLPLVTYTRGDDLSGSLQGAGGIGGLLARTDMGQYLAGDPQASDYYFSDARGNVVAMVNTNGTLVAQYEYDPFGNMIAMSGPLASANKYRFSSKEWDGAAGLYYYGFRFYDPNLQRWPNRDPLSDRGSLGYIGPSLNRGGSVGNNGGASSADALLGLVAQINVNVYGAIGNDPLNLYDSFGLCPTQGGPGQGGGTGGTGTGEQLGNNGNNGNPPFTLPTWGLPDLPPFPQMPNLNLGPLVQQAPLYPALVAGTMGKPAELPEPDQYDINQIQQQSAVNSVPRDAEVTYPSAKPPVQDTIYNYNGSFNGLQGDQIDTEEPTPQEIQLELKLGGCADDL